MKGLLNYWLLFTSLGFTVPFPACFLTSITCPAHLFGCSFIQWAFLPRSLRSPLRRPPRPSCQSERRRDGAEEEAGERNRKVTVACPYACTAGCAHPTCVAERKRCMLIFASHKNLQHSRQKWFLLGAQTRRHLLHARTKRTQTAFSHWNPTATSSAY